MKYRGFNKITSLIFIILFLLLLFITYRTPFMMSKPQLLEGWNHTVDQEAVTYNASHLIDKEMCGRTISFYTDYAFVDASIDGENVYHFGKQTRVGKTPGAYQHFVDIPENVEGKQLEIRIQYVSKKKLRDDYQYLFGDSASIAMYLLKRESLAQIANVLMLVFSIILFVLHILGKKDSNDSAQNVWLGILVMDFCLWAFSKSFAAQMLLHNSLFQYYAGIYFSFLSPIFLINYLKTVFPEIKSAMEYLCNLFMIMICILLHFLGICSLASSSRVFDFVMLVTIISMGVKVTRKFYQENEWSYVSISLEIFIVCLAWNALNHWLGIQGSRGLTLIQVGLIVYIVSALVFGAKKLIISAEESRAAEVYKEMAYTDNLTKLQNRHALRKNVSKMQLKDICVVSMDLNNLKYYNDNLGHAYGDKLIQEAARVIGEIYKDSYRTGGDEFVAILQKVTREQADSYRNQLIRSWKQFNESQDELVLEIASGNGFYNVGDESYEDIMKRADMNMYYDKSYLKQHSKIKSTR